MRPALRWLPLLAAIGVFVATVPFAWSKDFGLFLLGLFVYTPALLLVGIVLSTIALVKRRSPPVRPVLGALAVVLGLPPVIFFVTPHVKDRVRFMVWHAQNGAAERMPERDAILADWESWGMAGMENDAYLVSNPDGMLSDAVAARTWPRRVGSDCEAVAVERMARSLYIVTTFNCPLR